MTKEQNNLPTVPLAYAAAALADLCLAIDEGGDINEAVERSFKDAKLDLADAVAERITFLEHCEGAAERARKTAALWTKRARQLEEVHERVEQKTVDVMLRQPDLPYSSPVGRFAIQNAGGKAALEMIMKGGKLTISEILPNDLVESFKIAPQFTKLVLVYSGCTTKEEDICQACGNFTGKPELETLALNTDEIRKYLEEGNSLSWARLSRKQVLKVRE